MRQSQPRVNDPPERKRRVLVPSINIRRKLAIIVTMETDKEKAARQKWDELREKLGRKGFIWKYGVIRWGILTAILSSLMMGAWKGWEHLYVSLPVALIVFPIGGYFWGSMVWASMEKKYTPPIKA